MAAASVESPTPNNLNKDSASCRISTSMFSPSSDKRFWSALRTRIETIIENRKPNDPSFPTQMNAGESDRAKRMREDSMLLIRGFDSVAHSLSHLSQHLDNALQGARDLARPPTVTEIYHSSIEYTKNRDTEPDETKEEEKEDSDEVKRGLKRKLEECGDDSQTEKSPKEKGKLNKAKNLAISMATKAVSLGRELKSIKSDLCFMQERCAIVEEENRRLRDGFAKGIRPEEDDLVRLQLEALLAEKSRLANENANLTRENQCLHQLVEYHQITSQDLSASYEHAIRGMCLDFSSPTLAIPEEEEDGSEVRLQLEALLAEKSRLANENANLTRENQCLHQLVEYHQITSQDLSASYEHAIRGMCLDFSSPTLAIPEEEEDGSEVITTPRTGIFGLCTSLDECYDDEHKVGD